MLLVPTLVGSHIVVGKFQNQHAYKQTRLILIVTCLHIVKLTWKCAQYYPHYGCYRGVDILLYSHLVMPKEWSRLAVDADAKCGVVLTIPSGSSFPLLSTESWCFSNEFSEAGCGQGGQTCSRARMPRKSIIFTNSLMSGHTRSPDETLVCTDSGIISKPTSPHLFESYTFRSYASTCGI